MNKSSTCGLVMHYYPRSRAFLMQTVAVIKCNERRMWLKKKTMKYLGVKLQNTLKDPERNLLKVSFLVQKVVLRGGKNI